MIYLYAYTNHKENLDSLRRVASIYATLKEHHIDAEILINEYRAQLLLKEWGYPLATTIETIKDIDAVASNEDIVLIDSNENLEGKVLNYPNYFKKVIYINSSFNKVKFDGATIINTFLDKEFIFSNLKVNNRDKNNIYIFGDSDYNKTILKNSEIFKNKNLDLYWGIYFFVKYEDKLLEIFNKIIDSEEYYKILIQYQNIITSSLQTAIEAKANGANVEFLSINSLTKNEANLLDYLEIKVANNINITNNKKLSNKKINNINNKLVDIIKSNM